MEGKPLIFSAAIGKGHDQIAKALKVELHHKGHDAKIINTFQSFHPMFHKVLLQSYVSALKMTPNLWGGIYYLTRDIRLYKIFDRLGTVFQERLLSLIEENKPPFIITTHYFAAAFLANLKKKGKCNLPLYTIITDLVMHPIYFRNEIDGYFTACDHLDEFAKQYNTPIEKFYQTGIPIRKIASLGRRKSDIRKELNLDKNQKTVLIAGGGLGLTKFDKVVYSLREFKETLQILCMTAHNEKAKEKVKHIKTHHNVKVYGFTDEFTKYLCASDAIISKAGSVTISEALTCNVPIIIYHPVPGHEEQNAQFLTDYGATIKAEMSDSIPLLLERVLYDDKYIEMMSNQAKKLKRPNAAKDCIETLLSI